MIRINLLPHREWKRARQRTQAIAMLSIAVVVGAALVGAGVTALNAEIEHQQSRNRFIEEETAKLDRQIDEIKKLKEEIAQLLARKQVVETLQANRSEVVHLLDTLVRQLPEGMYLKTVKQVGPKVNLSGYAQSNARVSTLMRNLESAPWLENPVLVEIKAVTLGGQRMSEFSLTIDIKRPSAEDAKGGAKPAGGAKPTQGKTT